MASVSRMAVSMSSGRTGVSGRLVRSAVAWMFFDIVRPCLSFCAQDHSLAASTGKIRTGSCSLFVSAYGGVARKCQPFVTISVRCCHDSTRIVKLRGFRSGGSAMKACQGLLVCESLMARLDLALDHAAAEVQCTAAVEEQIRGLVSHLERAHQRLNEIEAIACNRNGPMLGSRLAANENPRAYLKESISLMPA
jgi:hypothetical protein